jgi:hypothetical protein
MESLIDSLNKISISKDWKTILTNDIQVLVHCYKNGYFNFEFPKANLTYNEANAIVDYISKKNKGRILLMNEIVNVYPNEYINLNDIDSIMDYYIYNLELIANTGIVTKYGSIGSVNTQRF